MPRRPTGSIVEHTGKDGVTYRALRFRAYGHRQYVALGALSRDQAERELRGVLARHMATAPAAARGRAGYRPDVP